MAIQQIDDGRPDGCTFVGNIVDGPTIQNALTANGTTCYGLRVKSKVPTALTASGDQTGIYIETEVTGTGTCIGMHYGLKVETYVESGATLSGDHYGAGIFTYSDVSGTKVNSCLRLEHNGASVCSAFIGVFNQTGKMLYLLESSMVAESWCGVASTVTIANGGWLRIKLGGYTRYIALGSTYS